MLLATAAVAVFASSADAKDFTGSLFLPSQGEVLSDTGIDFDRTKTKGGFVEEDFSASEELTYGVTDNFSVYGGVANYFDFPKVTGRDYNNDHNFAYELGAKYNQNFGNVLTQFGLGYNTFKPASWYGHRYWDNNEWVKVINAEAQIGYDMGNGFVPYATFEATSVVDAKDRVMNYAAFAGVHKTCDKVAIDTGLRYEFNTDEGANTNQVYWQAEADYFLKDNVALGVHGDYYLGGSDLWGAATKYDYTIGAQLKVLF